VFVNATEISSPFGRIPSKRVTFWSNSDDSKTSVGTSVATTLLLGGIDLLGFLAKTINPISLSMALMPQETMFLSAEDIIVAEQNAVSGPGVMQSQSPGRLSPSLTSAPLPVAAAADTRHCWSTYLNRNPAMKKWAESNPAQAAQNKRRFDDC
jgi:hypothetical protein